MRLPQLFNVFRRENGHSVMPLSREMSRWFADLPGDKPLVVIDSLAHRVIEIAAQKQGGGRRFRQYEIILKHADPLLKRIETQLDQSRLPLEGNDKVSAASADRLLKNISEALIKLVEELCANTLQRKLQSKLISLALLRAAQIVHRRAQTAQRAHQQGSARRWKIFRKLLVLAESLGISKATPDSQGNDTLEQVIVRDSLLHLCAQSNLDATELGRVRFYIERFGHLAFLRPDVPPAEDFGLGLFLLSDSARGPARLKPDHLIDAKERVLDCRDLVERVQQQLAGLREGLHATKLGLPMVANESAYAFMLTRCVEQWTEAKPRRKTDFDKQPLAEVFCGFDPVRQFLASDYRKAEPATSVLSGIQKRLAIAREWRILEQSHTGFSLRQAGPHTMAINNNELIAMRSMERSQQAHVCILRRSQTPEPHAMEIGLERLGSTAIPTTVTKTLNDGSQIQVTAIVVARVQAFDGGPGLLAPSGDMQVGMRFTIEQREGTVHFEVLSLAEKLTSCDLLKLKRTS